MFFAHSSDKAGKEKWQPLREHLSCTAAFAQACAAKFGAARAGRLAGLLHDLGKYTILFQKRLDGAPQRVDHSTAGARIVSELAPGGVDRGMAELIAYGIAGHHAGLPDKIGGDRSLSMRIRNDDTNPDPIWRDELVFDATKLMPAFHWDKGCHAFQLAMLGRMLFSCLVDADFRETECYYHKVEGKEVDRDWPPLRTIVNGLIVRFDAHMARIAAESRGDPKVNALRADILAHVRGLAGAKPGVFTLTVPTGGGKTLASLAFALEHAKAHGLDRIVYAIPFTSIIDQTATIFREALDEIDGEEIVLEHHSAIEEARDLARLEKDGEFAGKSKLDLAMEDWAAPVVVTTNVQLFESLFASRPSRCRKLHNLAKSVIVLDEAQTIPRHVLLPCVAALKELALNYGATIVLCTATQPALRAAEDEDNFKGGFEDVRELAPDPLALHEDLKRVTLCRKGNMSDDDLVAALAGTEQGLVIVNTRKHALALYRAAEKAELEGRVHLSTRQYAAHRRAVLADVRERLKPSDGSPPKPCRVIATSLVEAGVDLDFPYVWRAEAGLEQIWQAAGRCNREGLCRKEQSIVTVFTSPDNKPPAVIEELAAATGVVREKFPELMSLDALLDYFQEVYFRMGREGLDRIKMPDRNGRPVPASALDRFKVDDTGTKFFYRSVAEGFHLIEDGMLPVIVVRPPDSARAREALRQLRDNPNGSAGRIARELQSYIVQVPPKARARLIACGRARYEKPERFGEQFVVLSDTSLYEPNVGLLWEDADYLSTEDLVLS